MQRILVAALAALVLLIPATATGGPSGKLTASKVSTAKLQGTIGQKLPANKLVRVDAVRKAHVLRVPGSQARIHVGQRVELRGTTLRARGASVVLARNVRVVRSVAVRSSRGRSDSQSSSTDDSSDSSSGDDDHGNPGPGKGDDDHDNSGPGKGDDDDDDDNSGSGNGHDDSDDSTDDGDTTDDTDDTRDDTDDGDTTDDD